MPITQRKGKWFWGSQGPFDSKAKATEVAQAAHASGYQKLEKIETGAPMDGTKRQLTVTEIQMQEKKIKKHYLLDEAEGSTQSPRGKAKPPAPPIAHSHSHSHHLHKEDGGGEGLAGTVFTSTNAGIFNPTFGGNTIHLNGWPVMFDVHFNCIVSFPKGQVKRGDTLLIQLSEIFLPGWEYQYKSRLDNELTNNTDLNSSNATFDKATLFSRFLIEKV